MFSGVAKVGPRVVCTITDGLNAIEHEQVRAINRGILIDDVVPVKPRCKYNNSRKADEMNLHLQFSANSHESPIGDRVLVLRWLDEVVVDVENLRYTHLIAPVCSVFLEATVSARRVGKITKRDVGIRIITFRWRRVFTSTGSMSIGVVSG